MIQRYRFTDRRPLARACSMGQGSAAAMCESLEGRLLLSTWYVAPNGTDASGHGASPGDAYRTISYAVNHLAYGDTLLIEGGTYREQVLLPNLSGSGKQTTIKNYDSSAVVIKGSNLVSGWTLYSGNIWMKTGWTSFSRQVFVDFDATGDAPLTEVGQGSATAADAYRHVYGSDSVGSMFAGSFYDDTVNDVLYVWLADGSDPNNHVIEASTRAYWMQGAYNSHDYLIQGLAFRHSNQTDSGTRASLIAPVNSVVSGCDIQWADFAGVSPSSNGQIINNLISHNGNEGVEVGTVSGYLISGNTITWNNYRNYQVGWNAGWMKMIPNGYGTVSKNEIAWNNGSGIWSDTNYTGSLITISGNYVHDNAPAADAYAPGTVTYGEAGIKIECSKNVLIYNNVVTGNAYGGVLVSASDTVKVINNTIVGNRGFAAVSAAYVPRTGLDGTNYPLQHNRIYNNLIADNYTMFDLIMRSNYTDGAGYVWAQDNLSDYNLFYRFGQPLQLTRGNSYTGAGAMRTTLASWRAATSLDSHSLSADPLLLTRSGASYTLGSNSPAINAGQNESGYYTVDYAGYPRGTSYDVGAYEYHSGDAAGIADPALLSDPSAWVDDTLPEGATPNSDTVSGGASYDLWNWVDGSPTPYLNATSNQMDALIPTSGIHRTEFTGATATLPLQTGERLYAYVWLDPADSPSEIMLQWYDSGGSWSHRAYWGSNVINYGTNGTASRRYMGPLPPAGRWARLEIPASQVGLEGLTVTGLSLVSYDGRAAWDKLGKVPQNFAATVAGRDIFYNNSYFDGSDPSAGDSDDNAIAIDKQALMPGQTATFANYSSYSRGINGIMIDLASLAGWSLSTADFLFAMGNSNTPGGWASAPAPTSISIRPAAGIDGSDRVTILWPDNAIQKQWLQITILADARTGLAAADVFYFGNAIGESGNATADALVDATDAIGARTHPRGSRNRAPIDYVWDYNRDGLVDATDEMVARNNVTGTRSALKLITAPAEASGLKAVSALSAQLLVRPITSEQDKLLRSAGQSLLA